MESYHTGKGGHERSKPTGSGAWTKMFGYFVYRREEFMAHYHQRSNIESTFSMVKRKFGDSLRTKTDVAMVNEVLCKVLAHNLVVLIHEMYAWDSPRVLDRVGLIDMGCSGDVLVTIGEAHYDGRHIVA